MAGYYMRWRLPPGWSWGRDVLCDRYLFWSPGGKRYAVNSEELCCALSLSGALLRAVRVEATARTESGWAAYEQAVAL